MGVELLSTNHKVGILLLETCIFFNHIPSLVELGLYYKNKDCKKSFALIKKASSQGDVKAIYHMGLLYAEGHGIPRNLKKSLKYIEKAASQNYAPALYRRGLICFINQQYKEAIFLYKRSIKFGNREAYCNLGYCYEFGLGTQRNPEIAYSMYHKGKSNYNLGRCYEYGIGVKADDDKALQYFYKGFLEGSTICRCGIVRILERYVNFNNRAVASCA